MASDNFLFDIPKPIKNKNYSELRRIECSKHGLLKAKDKGVFLKSSWKERSVVLSSGCLYIFKDKNSRTYDKAFSLFGYNEISKENAEIEGASYPFKLCYALTSTEKVKYFSAETEKERTDWMIAIRNEMVRVHNIDSEIDDDSESSIDVTEIPISSKEFFNNLKIDPNYQEDADLDDIYNYASIKSSLPQPPLTLILSKRTTGNKPRPPPSPPAKPNFEASARWHESPVEGQKVLVKYGSEGTYMIRKSSDGCDVLLVISMYQPRKYKIYKENSKLYLDKNSKHFDSVNSLILYYRDNPLPMRTTKLKDPYSKL